MIKSFFKNNTIHKKIVPIFDILFLFRPTLFFVVWLMVSIGFYLGYLLNENINNYQWIFTFSYHTFFLYSAITLLTGASFVTNQISDVKADKINKKLFILNEVISPKKAKVIHKIVTICGFSLLFITLDLFIIVIGTLIFFLWDKVYNNKPFEWKNYPFLGPLCNILVGFLLILIGFCSSNHEGFLNSTMTLKNLNLMFLYIIPYLLCYLAVTIITDIPDILGDKANNKKSFSILIGKKKTIICSTLLVLFAFLLSYYLEDPLSSHSASVSFPFFLFAVFRGYDKDILRSIRYPIFIMNFFTMIVFPYLFIASIIIFYLSKYYYWHRFSLHYPTFLVDND